MEIDLNAVDLERGARVKDRGHFFLVDIPTFAAVCNLDDPDAAAAYLILAAGTGADNRTSTWSREAINQRTALNWRKARDVIDRLEAKRFVAWKTPKGARKPRLDLPPIETRAPMQKHVAAFAARLQLGEQAITSADKTAATLGCAAGWFSRDEFGLLDFVPHRPMVKAYLPMSLVGDEKGRPTGESTIVDRIRRARDSKALLLLVEMYAQQDLAEHGGIDRYAYVKRFDERKSVFATSQFCVLRFDGAREWVRNEARFPRQAGPKTDGKDGAQLFWERRSILQDAGALEWVYYMVEDDADDAMRIYPVAVARHSEVVWSEPESVVGCYATRAAAALAQNPSSVSSHLSGDTALLMPHQFTLPVDRLARKATLVGIPRLRCRARTMNTSRWRQELLEEAKQWVSMFRGIIAEHAPELLNGADAALANCADFNYGSTETSTSVQRDINDPSKSGKHGSALRAAVENRLSPAHDHHHMEEGRNDQDRREWDAGRDDWQARYSAEMDEHYRLSGERF